jgi:hypothetical protein
MSSLDNLINSLKMAGIQPQVTIVVDPNASDIQAIKTLQTNLKNAGILANVQINVSAGTATTTVIPTPDVPVPGGHDLLALRVKEPRLNCFTFRKTDKAGKPEMFIREPRVQLQQGAVFFVSSTHKLSQNDKGDGIVFGTGNLEFYNVVDCPPNPAAVGLYVRKMDVEKSI